MSVEQFDTPQDETPVPEKPRMSAEETAAHIKELGMASRYLRTHLQERYARAVEADMATHIQDLWNMGGGHLLESSNGQSSAKGAKTIFPVR